MMAIDGEEITFLLDLILKDIPLSSTKVVRKTG
jgi:hypothetical protein